MEGEEKEKEVEGDEEDELDVRVEERIFFFCNDIFFFLS